MVVGFVGYGKVARAFDLYLQDFNKFKTRYHSRSQGESLSAVISGAEIIFIATADDLIKDISEKIAGDFPSEILEQKIFGTFSGALSSQILSALREKGATTVSLHPPMTFADTLAAKEALPHILCAFEGSGARLGDLTSFLDAIKLKYRQISAEKKPVYHAAMCLASNYTAALLDAAVKMLVSVGLEPPEAMELLTPLVRATVNNCALHLPQNSLTGPIARGDSEVIKLHLNSLEPQFKNIYRTLGLWALEMACLAENSQTTLKEILENE